jgi:hypothetical protein
LHGAERAAHDLQRDRIGGVGHVVALQLLHALPPVCDLSGYAPWREVVRECGLASESFHAAPCVVNRVGRNAGIADLRGAHEG